MKQLMHNRIMAFLLALVLFLSNVPVSVFSVGRSEDGNGAGAAQSQLQDDYDTMYIAREGERIQTLNLWSHEKIEITAEGVLENARYQWQVQHPEKDGVWVNIYDGKEQSISVTLALVENVLRENGTAQLRCRAYTEQYAYLSNTLTVTVRDDAPAASTLGTQSFSLRQGGVMPMAEGDSATAEFVTVTVRYDQCKIVAADGGSHTYEVEKTDVFTAYVATLTFGQALPSNVDCPPLVGYTPRISVVTVDGVETAGVASLVNGAVQINMDSIQSNIVVTVQYIPIMVKYQVRYYFQNIYDDLYVENSSLKASDLDAQGYTGTTPALKQDDVTGFTCLYFQPDSIAADGSTVFHVYYERNYYLMEFDCNGGYGTDTLYVRYGTYIAVPNPVKAGYAFAGWDFVSAKGNDGNSVTVTGTTDRDVADVLPHVLPAYNSSYKALWKAVDTHYSVAYWLLDAEENKTYIGSRTIAANSGDTVSGYHDLDDGTFPICGKNEHTHSDQCYRCGLTTEHTHTSDCFTGMTLSPVPGVDYNRDAAIADLENGGDPESGYIYVIYNPASGAYWPKLYLDGIFYIVNDVGDGDPWLYDESNFSSIIDGEALAEKTGEYGTETLTTTKYRPATQCGTIQHTHTGSCFGCEEHDHTDNCYQDERHLEEAGKDKETIVKGDGSTVLNVYYRSKEYTLKFYYAISKDTDRDGTGDKFYVVGGSTYGFGSDAGSDLVRTNDLALLQQYTTGGWNDRIGEVQALPNLNELGNQRLNDGKYKLGSITSGDYTYYYIYFNARVYDDISELWPCAVFNSVTRSGANTHGKWSGTEAFVSAWNGEYYVKYSRDTSVNRGNQTIKGKYELLDENLLWWNYTINGETTFADTTETFDGSIGTIAYLCFWENGANIGWSVPELYRYNIWLEGNALNGERTTTRDGKTFYLADTYDTCDDSWIDKQTQVGLTGYKAYTVKNQESGYSYSTFEYKELTGSTNADQIATGEYFDNTLYAEGYDVNFYYTANRHSLKFWNHNGWLEQGKGAGNTGEGNGVRYGTPMKLFGDYVSAEGFMDDHYPEGLEPGAYEFAGWYTTALCLDGTEVKWDTMTMPDADLTVYAKWVPVQRRVQYFLTLDALNAYWDAPETEKTKYLMKGIKNPVDVLHGEVLGTAYATIPTLDYIDKNFNGIQDADEPTVDYAFVGWFYIDEDGKKRFAPDTMPVKQELNLFAEWRTKVDTAYTIQYMLQGTNEKVADDTVGHMSVGSTKTFLAKGNNELYPHTEGKFWFPVSASHSILMQPNPADNTHIFYYVEDDAVSYEVQYLDKTTGLPVRDAMRVENVQDAIVTEKFVHVDGYVPESYYITKVLESDGDDDLNPNNVIVFYYISAEEVTTGQYSVQFYQERLESDDPANPGNYDLVQTEILEGNLEETIGYTVVDNQYAGFNYEFAEVVEYTDDSENGTKKTYGDNESHLSGTLTKKGLEFKIYYSRDTAGYTIQFVDWDSAKILGYGKLGENGVVFDNQDASKRKVGSTATYQAPDSIPKSEGETVIMYYFFEANGKKQEQTLTFQADKDLNVLTFYYRAEEVTIFYHAVCLTPGAKDTDFGRVSQSHETLRSDNITGSKAMPSTGFRFMGWYDTPDCTGTKVCETDLFKPARPAEDVHYYALFEPITTDLSIMKEIQTGANVEETDHFLFRIQGTDKQSYINLVISISGKDFVDGAGTAVIKDLPVGTYVITELTDWSWEYGEQPAWTFMVGDVPKAASDDDKAYAEIVVDQDGGKILFTNSYTDADWLENETSRDNKFEGVRSETP